jgi:phosphocarrier protein HPr
MDTELVRKLKISNELGLHARAAAKIVALVGQYEASLFLKKDEREVDGSSILSVLTLACPRGTELQARAVGKDSEALLEALNTLFEQKFGEGR